MVRYLNFYRLIWQGLDCQWLASAPIDTCVYREQSALDLNIKNSIAGNCADLPAVDENFVCSQIVCVL